TAAIREIKPYLEKKIVKELKSVGGNKKRVAKPSFLRNFQTQVYVWFFNFFQMDSGYGKED
ncbi:MAG: hypothetical protein U9N46_14455, partial [Euryarchaeota archaeon]|nr:hypothetical protein [Euryarchaeota archaeon]